MDEKSAVDRAVEILPVLGMVPVRKRSAQERAENLREFNSEVATVTAEMAERRLLRDLALGLDAVFGE